MQDKKQENREKVFASVKSLDKQIRQAVEESLQISIPQDFSQADKILISCMGGSRFPAVVLQEFFKPELSKVIFVNDEYLMPGWVDENTACIFSSYSGTTEEVLDNLASAAEKTDKLVGITTGGDLAKKLQEMGKPVYVYDPVHNPSGQPRIAVGYAVGAIMGVLRRLGAIDFSSQELDEALDLLSKTTAEFAKEGSFVYQKAKEAYDKIPFYITAEFLRGFGNAANNQTNETAKSVADFHNIPELNHHLMEGLKNPSCLKDHAVFLFFYSDLYTKRIQKRFKITKEVVEKNNILTIWLPVEGKTKLEQLFWCLGFSSFFTLYLSDLYGEDPNVIPFVDYFKKRLKEDEA